MTDPHPFLNTVFSRAIKIEWGLCLYSEKRRNPLEEVLASRTIKLSRNIGSSKPDKRLASTLDSLAFLCTCLPRHQSVALSLTLPPDETRAIICLTQSDDIAKDAVVSFLSKLWPSLRELAVLIQNGGSIPRKPQESAPSGEINPVKEMAIDIWIDILRRGFEKVRYRFLKRSEQFRNFFEWWNVQDHSQDSPILIAAFSEVFLCMDVLLTHVSSKQLETPERPFFVELAGMLPRLHGICQQLFNYEFNDGKTSHTYFRLQPYLAKCISIYDHTQVLLKCAGSTRMNGILKRNLYVKSIPPQYRTNAIRPDSWKPYIEAVFVSAGACPDSRFDAAVEFDCCQAEEECDNARKTPTYSQMSSTTAAARIRVHCTCLLLSYHYEAIVHGSVVKEDGPDTNVLPMNYIGSSKTTHGFQDVWAMGDAEFGRQCIIARHSRHVHHNHQ
ncbi:hypothetical protein BD410DRAFT_827108 [Rickenella mellea]|uniref:Uncharacterized protein n=1 Tax=Rickenella mellea TaxID=50990 RepID=A0A4Y7QB40_9AGAM|nr:hypothetical protein BD410DRAFT_827108 [Rickenella mellea]